MKIASNVLDGTLNQVDSVIDLRRAAIPAAGKFALRLLKQIGIGSLRMTLPNGQQLHFGNPEDQRDIAFHADLVLHNWRVCTEVARSGDIGFAETYINQDWTTSDLAGLLKLFVANRERVESIVYGSWLGQLSYRIKHWFNRNTKDQARKNIHAHYDLGNSFYRLWLDRTMTYSSALFGLDIARTFESLPAAQKAKYERVLQELDLRPHANVLEIGFGWGGMAETLANAGHTTTGLTLSTEQLAWAQDRLAQQNLADKADFRLEDYRDHHAQYDGIASIEMFEAVGAQYWDDYFKCLNRCLKPGAKACIQSITIDESLFERYRKGTDFIQQYIFPGGMLPTKTEFQNLAKKNGFVVRQVLAFGIDYAHTLRLWREQFMAQLEQIRPQGFDDRFIRTWEFYLAYCEAAFDLKNTDVCQFTLQKAGA